MDFFENIQEKTQQLKEKTQNSRQKLKVSAKSKTQFAENASKKSLGWVKNILNFGSFKALQCVWTLWLDDRAWRVEHEQVPVPWLCPPGGQFATHPARRGWKVRARLEELRQGRLGRQKPDGDGVGCLLWHVSESPGQGTDWIHDLWVSGRLVCHGEAKPEE